MFKRLGNLGGTKLGAVHVDHTGGSVDELGFVRIDGRGAFGKAGKVDFDDRQSLNTISVA